MFTKRVVGLLLFLVVLMFYTFDYFRNPSKTDYRRYEKLMTLSDQEKKSTKKDAEVAKQKRTNIKKQLIFKQNDQRLQWRLDSDQSEVVLAQHNNSLEFVEHLKNVNCQMQEQFLLEKNSNLPQQLVRQLLAKDAKYNYRAQQLKAHDVDIARYKMSGTNWQNVEQFTPIMQGSSHTVELTFLKEPIFRAKGFRASFSEKE